jgi:hypothetical protein
MSAIGKDHHYHTTRDRRTAAVPAPALQKIKADAKGAAPTVWQRSSGLDAPASYALTRPPETYQISNDPNRFPPRVDRCRHPLGALQIKAAWPR